MSIEHAIEIDSDLACFLSDLDNMFQEGLITKSELLNKATIGVHEYLSKQNGIQLIAIHKPERG